MVITESGVATDIDDSMSVELSASYSRLRVIHETDRPGGVLPMTKTETSDTEARGFSGADTHELIWPAILYFGTPIALVTTLNADESPNIGPMSSVWALGYTVVMGWENTAHTLANLERERECVVNLADETLVEQVETLAPLTGSNPPAAHKAGKFHFEPRKFDAAGLTEQESETVKPPRISCRYSSRPRSQRSTIPPHVRTAHTSE
jgi:flavin reductase (DIM6/NTAB) family NADH-FMN oxidoreductase RutF